MYECFVDFLVELACYDNEGEGAVEDTGTPDTTNPSDRSVTTPKTFTTEEVNRIVEDRLARDRKNREESNKKLEKQLQKMLQSKQLSEQERDQLQSSLEGIQKQLRIKESQLAHEKQQMQVEYEEQLKIAQQQAVDWENRFRSSSIEQALHEAASTNEAYNISQVVNLLKPMTRLMEGKDEDGKPTGNFEVVIDFPDVDPETGEPFTAKYTPDESVKRMKELPEHVNLFKANVVSGVGAMNATGGLTPGSNGQVDVKNLTPAQYMKLRKEQPELFGFKK